MPIGGFADIVAISFTPTSVSVYDDSFTQINVVWHFDDGTSRTITSPEDKSRTTIYVDDTDVATISQSVSSWGRVRGVAPGTTTIRAFVLTTTVPEDIPRATAAATVTAHPAYVAPTSRFCLGFGFATLDPYPTWTAIDAHPNLVTTISIDRGRSYELDQTDAGRATVTITDPDGILDPTNPSGPYYGQIRPLLHGVISRRNPVTGTWEERYRGFVDDYTYDVDPSQRLNKLTISLGDLFEVLAIAEMQPQSAGDIPLTIGDTGQVKYGAQRPDERISQILRDAGVPNRMQALLRGTVHLRPTTYSPGESALSAIQEAADGEFPNLANVFVDRHGRLCFRGRPARFDPAATAAAAGSGVWDYHAWKAGDSTAVTASPTDTAHVRALGFQRGVSRIINNATALPVGLPDDYVWRMQATDVGSVNTYGLRSWSASNLLTLRGGVDGAGVSHWGAVAETRRFAEYYVANYAQPRDRITEIAFRSLHPDDPRAAANWDLLTRVDIGDTIQITVHTPGGGGFISAQYFVEGIHEDARPLAPGYDDVTLTLDLSPRDYYATDPWAAGADGTDPDPPELTDDNNPTMRSGKPKPTVHGREHEHDGPDPIRTHYEKVGTEPGEGGGGDLDPLAIRYITDNVGDWLDIVTEDVVPGGADGLGGEYGTYIHADTTGSGVETRTAKIRAKGSGPNTTALTLEALNNAGGTPVGLYSYVPSPGGTGLLVAVNNGTGLEVTNAAGIGIVVDSAAGNGIRVTCDPGPSGWGLFVTVGDAELMVTETGVHVSGVLSVNGVTMTVP